MEWPFHTGVGGVWKIWLVTQKRKTKKPYLLCIHEKHPTPTKVCKNIQPPSSSYFIYIQKEIQYFFMKLAFL